MNRMLGGMLGGAALYGAALLAPELAITALLLGVAYTAYERRFASMEARLIAASRASGVHREAESLQREVERFRVQLGNYDMHAGVVQGVLNEVAKGFKTLSAEVAKASGLSNDVSEQMFKLTERLDAIEASAEMVIPAAVTAHRVSNGHA